MPPNSQGPPVSSLAKLQALDSTYEDIDERIGQAAKIIGFSATDGDSKDSFSHPRADWALRWIVDKVKPKSKDGKPFRAITATWDLLIRLITLLSANGVANALTGVGILEVVELALQEWISDSRLVKDSPSQTNGSLETSPLSSRKRKRSEEDAHVAAKAASSTVEITSLSRRHARISDFVRALVMKGFAGEDDSTTGQERIKTHLRLGSKPAADLLRAELTSTVRLYQLGQHLDPNHIDCFINIWRHRSLESVHEYGLPAKVFSDECLVPLSLLHGVLLGGKLGVAMREDVHSLIGKLEHLVYEHIIYPAKTHFLELSRQPTTSDEIVPTSLSALLSPLQQAIPFLRERDPRQAEDILSTLPKIYDLAIKHGRKATQKQRSQEFPWLEDVFVNLLACVRADETDKESKRHKKGRQDRGAADDEILEELLESNLKHKVPLSQPLIAKILQERSGLMSSPSPESSSLLTVRWSLVKLLIKLNSELFLGSSSDGNISNGSTFGEYLVAHISNATTKDEVPQLSSTQRYNMESFITDIVVGLLEAHSQSKEVPRFFKSWYSQLAAAAAVMGPEELLASAWMNDEVIAQAGLMMQQSCSALLIQETLDKTLVPAVARMLHAFSPKEDEPFATNGDIGMSNSDPIANLYASIVLIQAILIGISQEDVVSRLKTSIDRIWVLLQQFIMADLPDFLLADRIWDIMTRIQQLQRQLHPTGIKYRDDGRYLMHPGVLDLAVRTVKECNNDAQWRVSKTQRSAFLFLVTVSACMQEDVDIQTTVQESLRECTKAYFSGCAKQKATQRTSMAFELTLISSNPYLLSIVDKETCDMVLEQFLMPCQEAKQVSLQGHDDSFPLERLQEAIILLDDRAVHASWTNALVHIIASQTNDITPHTTTVKNLLLRMNLGGSRKQTTEALGEAVIQAILHGSEDLMMDLAILHKVIRIARAHINLTTDSKVASSISKKIDISGIQDARTLFSSIMELISEKPKAESVPQTSQEGSNASTRLSALLSVASPASLQSEQERAALITGLDRNKLNSEDMQAAKRILPSLAKALQNAQEVYTVGYTLNDILVILRTKPFMVTQYGIESVFDVLGLFLAPTKFFFLQPHASQVFLRVCQITNAILSFHRKNISGRMHLLVPFIQTLMNSTFILHANSKPAQFQKSPSWLHTREDFMDATNAVAFSRILLTLTQPTVSSSTSHYRSHNNPLLTDETRKARQYAAQYVPYILAHFCSLNLIGRLSPDVRKALMPGIYTCIEAVPREGLRGMNAGMGREDRAIWSALWAEWSRSRSTTS